MSTTLITRVTGTIRQSVQHPVRTASYGIGLARGVAAALLRAASGGRDEEQPEPRSARPSPPDRPTPAQASDPGPSRVAVEEFPPAAPQRAPGEVGESFATEPHAVSRASAHGGGGDDAEIDDWYGETEAEDDVPGSVIEALEFGDGLAEEADEKAILSDAETLRRAASLPDEKVE